MFTSILFDYRDAYIFVKGIIKNTEVGKDESTRLTNEEKLTSNNQKMYTIY